ncbi:MAG: VanW family protein [Candidatus Portnoybacteria bacterium]|nr:VanW family protein [Candidatus Portnoybacteria bacterium]
MIKGRKIISSLLIAASLLAIFCLSLLIVNRNRVALGISLGNEKIGGLAIADLKTKIEQKTTQAQEKSIRFIFQENEWLALPSRLGIIFDAKKTQENIVSFGRGGNLASKLSQPAFALFFGKRFSLAYSFDEEKFLEFARDEFKNFETPAQNAKLKYDQQADEFSFISAASGEVFDRTDIKDQIEKQLQSSSEQSIKLKKIVDQPTVLADENGEGQRLSRKILMAAPYSLKVKNDAWPIPKETLADWLEYLPGSAPQTMRVSLSQEAIKEYLISLTPVINKKPSNANLALDANGNVIAFSLAQNGIDLQIDESTAKIKREILEGNNKISLIFEETEPEISEQTIDALGLTHLLGTGVSDFAGSPSNRIHNIKVGAAKITGMLLKSGEEFSFINRIGEIEASTGYLPELVIKRGKTIPEYGGGICQISTTLFRAAVNAGLKITERQPHAFPVKYYNPQGFDSTIYPPHPDLRFINDTPNNILLQAKIEGTKITFEIYGTADGRETKVIGPTILQSNPDGSMKTILYQEIWRNGELERRATFSSNYKSPALYPVEKNPLE